MTEAIGDVLSYPLTRTVSLVEALWLVVGVVCILLAIRKLRFARAYEQARIVARFNADRQIVSRMNVRTAVMATVVSAALIAAGGIAATLPSRPDEYADASAFVTLTFIALEAWFARWLVLDWRDALELRRRMELAAGTRAATLVDNAQETADRAQGTADAVRAIITSEDRTG